MSSYTVSMADNCGNLRLSMNELSSNEYSLPSVNAYGMQYEDFLRYQSNDLDYSTSSAVEHKEPSPESGSGQKCLKYPDTNQNYDDYEAEAYSNAMLPATAASYYTQLPYPPTSLTAFPLQLAVPFQQTGAAGAYGAQPMQGGYLHYGNYGGYEGMAAQPQTQSQAPVQQQQASHSAPPSLSAIPAPNQTVTSNPAAMQQHHHHHFGPGPGMVGVGVGVGVGEMLFEQQQRKDDEISNILAGVRKTCYSN